MSAPADAPPTRGLPTCRPARAEAVADPSPLAGRNTRGAEGAALPPGRGIVTPRARRRLARRARAGRGRR